MPSEDAGPLPLIAASLASPDLESLDFDISSVLADGQALLPSSPLAADFAEPSPDTGRSPRGRVRQGKRRRGDAERDERELCPFRTFHRLGPDGCYRMPISGVRCCNMCRRRLVVWSNGFRQAYHIDPMLNPRLFNSWAKETMARCSYRWFRALYRGLNLGENEEVSVVFGTQRLGFFQESLSKSSKAPEYASTHPNAQQGLLWLMQAYWDRLTAESKARHLAMITGDGRRAGEHAERADDDDDDDDDGDDDDGDDDGGDDVDYNDVVDESDNADAGANASASASASAADDVDSRGGNASLEGGSAAGPPSAGRDADAPGGAKHHESGAFDLVVPPSGAPRKQLLPLRADCVPDLQSPATRCFPLCWAIGGDLLEDLGDIDSDMNHVGL